MQIVSYTTKLKFQSIEDKNLMMETLKAEAKAFDMASKLCYQLDNLSIKTVHSASYYKIREQYPEIPSQIVIKGEQCCLSSLRTCRANRILLEKPPVKSNLSLRLDKRIYTYNNLEFKFTTVKGRIRVKFVLYKKLESLLQNSIFGDPLLFHKNNEIYISFPFKVETTEPTKELAIGVDLGINRVAATSEGLIFKNEAYNAKKRQLRYLKRSLQAKGTKSARKHSKKLSHKERNRSKDFCRKLANSILTTTKATVIVLEDLTKIKPNVKAKNKYKNQNKLSQAPFHLLRTTIEKKALLLGKRATTVNPSYTSQIDHRTQKKDGARKGSRYYTKSGQVLDADVNAAINIAIRSKLPFSSSNGLDGQAAVIRPNACKSS